MSKTVYASALVALCIAASAAQALTPEQQAKIVKSQEVLNARKCLDDLANMGRKANYDTDRDGIYSMVLNQQRSELVPMLVATADCFDAAFPKHELVQFPKTGVKSRVWYAVVEGQYVWCASSSLTNNAEAIDVLGGKGPKRNWFGVIVKCGIDQKVLGWYQPKA